jgi:hypothetical protein
MNKNSSTNIGLIEYHDALLSRLLFSLGNSCVLEFDHVNVYYKVTSDEYEIWSHRAELQLDNVTKESIVMPGGDSDYLVEGAIVDDMGNEIDSRELIGGCKKKCEVDFSFSSGAKIVIFAQGVKLLLLEKIRLIDTWKGSL